MRALDRKLLRDLRRLKGQVATIALVLACGIMAMIMLRGTFASLLRARDAYYADQQFADAFARLERAPEAVAARLERIPGVARLATRVVKDVMVPLADEPDPVTGRIVTLPSSGTPPLDRVLVRAGRMPAPGAPDEALILEQFAKAHGLRPGDTLPAVLNGTFRRLAIVGIALSPEYLFANAGTEPLANERRFVVIWMRADIVAPVFRMEGAFNDVALALQPGASLPAVLDAVDRELAPYGGFHAIGRDRQLSNYVLRGELDQLESLALMIPVVFLLVAAFLVNVVISRLVYLERTQIAILKALGWKRGQIALHYLGMVAVIVALGSAVGAATGIWAGTWMTNLYTGFFNFPRAAFRLSPGVVAVSIGAALAAAVVGALASVRRVARMPPAEAMRPPTPPSYKRSFGRLGRLIGPSAMMTVREIARRPGRFLLSTTGIAMGIAIFIMGRFSWDSFDRLFIDDFLRMHREDMVVRFATPRPARAVQELAHLPGVDLAEGSRAVAVRFRSGARVRDGVIIGLPHPSELHQLLHARTQAVTPPPEGVIVTDKLAEILGVAPGDRVDVEVLEGTWTTRSLTVTALIDEPFGLQGYARADWLAGFLREQPRVTSVLLRVDPARADDVRARIKAMPAVVGTSSTFGIIARYRKQTGQSIGVITLILTLSAAAIAIGIVYNNARIALSLRSRDLASLRVLGFTRREISSILLGELGAQVLAALPLGMVLGRWWAKVYAATINPEALRLPFYVADRTYATAAAIALVSGLVSALLVRRKLDQLDLIGVLKATE